MYARGQPAVGCLALRLLRPRCGRQSPLTPRSNRVFARMRAGSPLLAVWPRDFAPAMAGSHPQLLDVTGFLHVCAQAARCWLSGLETFALAMAGSHS